MKVLIACEESQAIAIEFDKRGFDVKSCDLQDCSGGRPDLHIKDSIFHVLHRPPYSVGLDLLIAHPPCTYLANSGVSWLYNKDGSKNKERWEKMEEAAIFFRALLYSNSDRICIENPIMHKHALRIIGIKHSQIIQPYHFGHTESKATCFWLKGLPKLKHTKNVRKEWLRLPKQIGQRLHYLPPGPERAKLRSKTFPGIAQAMAQQWGDVLLGIEQPNLFTQHEP